MALSAVRLAGRREKRPGGHPGRADTPAAGLQPPRRPARGTLLSVADAHSPEIFPDQVRIGDRFTDAETGDEAQEWEVASRPVTFKKGHEVRARVQRPGQPATAREKYWAAHEKITVRRGTLAPAATSRPTPEPVDVDDVEALRKELRRLRGEVLRLEDDKRELERRLGFMQLELERARAKAPRGISTS